MIIYLVIGTMFVIYSIQIEDIMNRDKNEMPLIFISVILIWPLILIMMVYYIFNKNQ